MLTETLPIRVIYIMGTGRSGSTVLDTVLGNHSQIESVGELTNLPKSAWINGEYCACGERGNECPFWEKVKLNWMQRCGVKDISGYVTLQSKFERFRSWPRLFRERINLSAEFQVYSVQTQALFEAIQAVSGKSIIVDSSKSPVRAFALSQMSGIDLVLIHLVRDGRGVAYSLSREIKKDLAKGVQNYLAPKPIWRTALFWIITNLQSEWMRRQVGVGHYVLVRYEDFVQKPREILLRIGVLARVNLSSLADTLDAGEAMVVRHTIAGNRVRMKSKIRIRLDETWKTKFTLKQSKLFWNIAGWLMQRYSYDKD